MTGRRRGRRAGFLVVWLVVWGSAMLIALWLLGNAVLEGEAAPAVVLAVWLVAAGFGLRAGVQRLRRTAAGEPEVRRRPVRHGWRDGMPGER